MKFSGMLLSAAFLVVSSAGYADSSNNINDFTAVTNVISTYLKNSGDKLNAVLEIKKTYPIFGRNYQAIYKVILAQSIVNTGADYVNVTCVVVHIPSSSPESAFVSETECSKYPDLK